MNTIFIHIGKTGGTTINKILTNKINNYIDYHSWRKEEGDESASLVDRLKMRYKNYTIDDKYILWIRNPISRFVSAFNQSYYAVNIDKNSIKSFDLDNCLLPHMLSTSIKRGCVFSKEYDSLIKYFKSANHLAESLSSDNLESKTNAQKLMSYPLEHLYKGIGWYLNNGDFVKNNDKIIFVGRQEFMKDDIKRLSTLLNVELDETTKLRENVYLDKSMKYLSPLAIKNIIEWYKDTDYAALEQLCNHGWIDKELLLSYYTYQMPEDVQPLNTILPRNNIIYKCFREGCNFQQHTNIKNNGGTHCCLACKRYNNHGLNCKKIIIPWSA